LEGNTWRKHAETRFIFEIQVNRHPIFEIQVNRHPRSILIKAPLHVVHVLHVGNMLHGGLQLTD